VTCGSCRRAISFHLASECGLQFSADALRSCGHIILLSCDTTVPIPAKGKTETGRVWVYVRDDKPFGGAGPPAALFYASRDRTRERPERHLAQFAGLLQADAYDGYNRLYLPDRKPGPITEALCWSHARRKFFELADIATNARRGKDAPPISPIAFEAVKRIDALFSIEREINGLTAEQRLAAREERSAPLVDALEGWMRDERVRLSRHASVAKAIDYMLKRWPAFTGFLRDGRICLSNNAAERALRGLALGRKSWLFAGSERGAERAAVMYTLIGTAKLQEIDPQAWLADVLRRINDQPVSKLNELLPWNWRKHTADQAVAA
jgi:transposase